MMVREGSWWEEEMVIAIFKEGKKRDPGNYELVIPSWIFRNIEQQILLKGISGYTKDQKVIGTAKDKS